MSADLDVRLPTGPRRTTDRERGGAGLGWTLLWAAVFFAATVLTDLREIGSHAVETGDFSADSLRALHAWGQTDGIFSRWGYHHPGPLLFWLIATGSGLGGVLGLSPFAGQQLVCGLLATTALTSLATALAPTRRPGWYLPVALLVGFVALPDSVVLVPWAPTVANWFFLLGVAGVVALARGRRHGLPVLAVATMSLVHLHVLAIPLAGLLVVLGAAALRTGRVRPDRRTLTAGGAVVLGLGMPLVVALARGTSPWAGYLAGAGAGSTARTSPTEAVRHVLWILAPSARTPSFTLRTVDALVLLVAACLLVLLLRSAPTYVRYAAGSALGGLAWLVAVSPLDFLTNENLGRFLTVLAALTVLAHVAARPLVRRWVTTALATCVVLATVIVSYDTSPFTAHRQMHLTDDGTAARAYAATANQRQAGIAIAYAERPWRSYAPAAGVALLAARDHRSWCMVGDRWPHWADPSMRCTAAELRDDVRVSFSGPRRFTVERGGATG